MDFYGLDMNFNTFITLLIAMGVIFTTWFNFKKLTQNIRTDEQWRTEVDFRLEQIDTNIQSIKGLEGIVARHSTTLGIHDRFITEIKADVKDMRSEITNLRGS